MNQYSPESHEYTMSGARVPSVTQALPPIDFYCTPDQLEAARTEGEQQHAMLEMYFDTGLTFEDEDLILIDQVFKKNEQYLGSYVMHEEALYSKKHNFAGKPDVVFEKAIVDLKRTLVNPRHTALQFAGYNLLVKENKVIPSTRKWYVLHRAGEDYKLVNVYNSLAEDMFISCLKKIHIEIAIDNYFKT